MTQKHTPGPWLISNYPHARNHPWIDAACNHNPNPAGGDYYMSVSGPISQDDARLIAAAPDMLTLADRYVESLEAYYDDTGEGYLDWQDALEIVAKARGVQS